MKQDFIKIRGAKVHNLKNINLDIPKNKLVVITGVSGSGKSSLAFDTLYAEGQRRYVESLSAYARQFLGVMQKPEVDKIEGISPAISIDQRKAAHNPRSTVGTMTEIYDYLRVLFARVGVPHCPKCGKVVTRQTIDQIVEQILKLTTKGRHPEERSDEGSRGKTARPFASAQGEHEVLILGPVVRGKKGEHRAVLEEIERAGFVRVRIDRVVQRIEEALARTLARYKKHQIEVVVDRLVIAKDIERSRLVDSVETALKLGKGIVIVSRLQVTGDRLRVTGNRLQVTDNRLQALKSQKLKPKTYNLKPEDEVFSEHFACEECGISLPEIEPRLFSFNSPYGACPSCQGLGKKLEVAPELCIPNPNLSIAEGAIFPWAHASHKVGRQGYFWWKLQDLAQEHNFSLDRPVKNLPRETLDIILHGDGDFEGVIPGLERRYWETDSEAAREEIKKYMREKRCEKCQGKRLKEEALTVTLRSKSIAEVVEMSIEEGKRFFEAMINPTANNKSQPAES